MSIEQLQYDWEYKQEIKLRGELYVEIINSKQKEEPSKRLVELFCDLVNNTLTGFKYNQDLYDDLFQSALSNFQEDFELRSENRQYTDLFPKFLYKIL